MMMISPPHLLSWLSLAGASLICNCDTNFHFGCFHTELVVVSFFAWMWDFEASIDPTFAAYILCYWDQLSRTVTKVACSQISSMNVLFK